LRGVCHQPATGAPIFLNNVPIEKFCFAKLIWRGLFLFIFHSVILVGCRDQGGIALVAPAAIVRRIFLFARGKYGFSQKNALDLT
jgi:hypothetical protein